MDELPRVVKEFSDGHFYSAIPDLGDVRRREATIFAKPDRLPGIDLGDERQLALLPGLARETQHAPFADQPHGQVRYAYNNDFFGAGDALAWFGVLRLRRPSRVIEVGSGWSSAVLLDAIDATDGWEPEVTFVEPYPDRLQQLVREEDDAVLYPMGVQDVPLELFATLQPGDALFIDSTHAAKIGSDVNLLLLEILPQLAAGVLVHIHDIFYPFEYPSGWVYGGRAWTEAYVLRALLIGNASLRIVWWNNYMATFHRDAVTAAIPRWGTNTGGSIYLETL
ncbi:hypothetical protein DSM104299_00189 [Baekduia alba]|uniref:class I SAM-dependent methyltransferase n=1 Tax=Baekduia alba TaxID=2997333 RepID=UPI002340DD3D|nr:class I SAM-dependent methyltransferase [Baekduia alba]WCB91518.1 hypothetical protein DSM104299_00189 [Baekduia alba]